MRDVAISVFPRLHVGLLSMHAGAPRMNGGIGFAVDGPAATIEAKSASSIEVEDARRFPMGAHELEQLRNVLLAFFERLELEQGAAFRIHGAMQTHVGMGSATAIRLATLQALALINSRAVTRGDLVAASGRGGTSGIGVNSYFDGGLVCDLGRASDGSHFSPSSQIRLAAPALALPWVKMPDWPVLLCIPRSIRSKTQEEEIAFFDRTAPLPASASFEASYIALFELYAAAAEADFGTFCRGIEHMQQTAWKWAERAEYGDELASISTRLRGAGAQCVGMSSLGPMLFCLGDAPRLVDMGELARSLGCDIHLVRPVNHGCEVRCVDA